MPRSCTICACLALKTHWLAWPVLVRWDCTPAACLCCTPYGQNSAFICSFSCTPCDSVASVGGGGTFCLLCIFAFAILCSVRLCCLVGRPFCRKGSAKLLTACSLLYWLLPLFYFSTSLHALYYPLMLSCHTTCLHLPSPFSACCASACLHYLSVPAVAATSLCGTDDLAGAAVTIYLPPNGTSACADLHSPSLEHLRIEPQTLEKAVCWAWCAVSRQVWLADASCLTVTPRIAFWHRARCLRGRRRYASVHPPAGHYCRSLITYSWKPEQERVDGWRGAAGAAERRRVRVK